MDEEKKEPEVYPMEPPAELSSMDPPAMEMKSMSMEPPPEVEGGLDGGSKSKHGFDYDLFVIGGGSGGLACAKAAKALGANVALADFVRPSPAGTKWGLGGTCVNVGCIPKKLMHFAGFLGEMREDQEQCGFKVDFTTQHSWEKMRNNVSTHIKKLNWGYEMQLIQKGLEYFNMAAKFVDKNTLEVHLLHQHPYPPVLTLLSLPMPLERRSRRPLTRSSSPLEAVLDTPPSPTLGNSPSPLMTCFGWISPPGRL